jgi:hypothetical protein
MSVSESGRAWTDEDFRDVGLKVIAVLHDAGADAGEAMTALTIAVASILYQAEPDEIDELAEKFAYETARLARMRACWRLQ